MSTIDTSKELLTLALEAVEIGFKAEQYMTDADYALQDKAVAALREALANEALDRMAENAKELGLDYEQEPVVFPARKAVEREIERTANPTGMHLNDGKERVALPGGTLRHMLALIDRTSPPSLSLAQRKPLTDEQVNLFINGHGDEDDEDYVEPTGDGFGLTDADLVRLVRRVEAAHDIKENT